MQANAYKDLSKMFGCSIKRATTKLQIYLPLKNYFLPLSFPLYFMANIISHIKYIKMAKNKGETPNKTNLTK